MAVGGGICDKVGKARRGSIGNRRRGMSGRLARWIVGIYHSRWRAVAARGSRQFTADRRTGGLMLLAEGTIARRVHASSRVFARLVRYTVRQVSVKGEVLGESVDRENENESVIDEGERANRD